MILSFLLHLLTFFLDLLFVFGSSINDKNLEIMLLRQQVRILQRKVKSLLRISLPEKPFLHPLFLSSTDHLLMFTNESIRSC